MKVLLTGGAGLVGSEMCAQLLERGASVFCVDDLSLGTEKHIAEFRDKSGFAFEKLDVSVRDWHKPLYGKKFDLLVHLAANSDISLGHEQPWMDRARTFDTTFEALTAARALGIPDFIFASTSAVYGENPVFPTPEDARNMHPVSIYGAGKLASEAYISAFVANYGPRAWVFRFGNVVGRKLTHGVIHDFIRKLRKNPAELAVLGNGKQSKTYINVGDCARGMLMAYDFNRAGLTGERAPSDSPHAERFQVFNLSTRGSTTVREIAEEAVRVVTRGKARVTYGASPVGWVGDVPKTSLAVERMSALGWEPKADSTAAVFSAIRAHHEWSAL